MNTKHIGLVSCAGLLLLCVFISIATVTISRASVTELNVPSEVAQGKEASISGKASPNEAVWLSSSFEISLPVSDGKYSCDFTGIHFPAGEKTFSVTAENVNDIRASLSPVFWQTIEYPLSGPENATANSIATLSVSFPATMHGAKINIKGKKNVTVYGDAAEGATSVTLKSAMAIKVTADSNGDFVLNISTEGVPTGEFLISAGGMEKTVHVVSAEELTPTPTPSSSPTPSPTPIEEEKTYENIPAGEEVKVELLDKELTITFKKNVSGVKITAKELVERPTGVPDAPGIVFRYLECHIENVSPEDIEKITIPFDVPKSWIASENIDPVTIKLNRYYEGVWNPLRTEKVGEDGDIIRYSAEAGGLSLFAITGEKKMETTAITISQTWIVIAGIGISITLLLIIGGVIGYYYKKRRE